ncbi:MAG: hypothetical protein IJT54_06630 [Candidatus Methanomethylophilaceae archaeon]|nr:hypothetical protein [Candidatus Methanomethylophilaceae archaeon]
MDGDLAIIYPFDVDTAKSILKGETEWWVPPQRATSVPNVILLYLNEARSIIGSVKVTEEIYRNAATIYNTVYPDEKDTITTRRDFWDKHRQKIKLSAYKLEAPRLFARPLQLSEFIPNCDGPRNGAIYRGQISEEIYG